MTIYSYVVARDYGFAPNPFFGHCTLATCKSQIRKRAQRGDWVVGTGSKKHGLGDRLIYAMRVSETLTFDEYWSDSRFLSKRPNLHGSIKQAFGDNIYHRAGGNWCQAKSHHSHKSTSNLANVSNDTKVDRVLVSDWFVYFGKGAIEIPKQFRRGKGETIIRGGRGHLAHFTPEFVGKFNEWVTSIGPGLKGEPMEFRNHLAGSRADIGRCA